MPIVDEGIARVLLDKGLGRTALHPAEYVDDDNGCGEGSNSYGPSFGGSICHHPDMGARLQVNPRGRRALPTNDNGEPVPAMWRENTMAGNLYLSKASG